ncbi:MAG TPA: UDP-glucose/GDP-mannose dehydrogenase family protein [Fimbriimonadaceae bacterium]|jgi:UDPglucose 6-dehydrogenase
MRIAVIGTGYVGLVTGVVLAEFGHDVICVDKDPEKVEKLKQGIPTIYEPGLEELLKRGVSEGRFKVTASILEATRASEVIFIAVGTPPGEDGAPDLTQVREAAAEIGKGINEKKVIVNKSTVPVGTGDLVEKILLENGAPADCIDVVSSPEFLREGSAIRDTFEPDRVIIGASKRSAALKLVELYAPLERPMLLTDLHSAELIKYASNSFLAMKISFINAMSQLCELAGANVGDVAKGIGADSRIGTQFLHAGLGWGGSCFPKDVTGLLATANSYGYDLPLLKAVIDINKDQTRLFLERMEFRLGGFNGKKIAMLGLAFKPNTDDIRDAKSIEVIERIVAGGGFVRAFDPVATANMKAACPPNNQLEYADGLYDVAIDADALILVTEWNEFRNMDLGRMRSTMNQGLLYDGRRIYDRATVEQAGFEYHVIGESTRETSDERLQLYVG